MSLDFLPVASDFVYYIGTEDEPITNILTGEKSQNDTITGSILTPDGTTFTTFGAEYSKPGIYFAVFPKVMTEDLLENQVYCIETYISCNDCAAITIKREYVRAKYY